MRRDEIIDFWETNICRCWVFALLFPFSVHTLSLVPLGTQRNQKAGDGSKVAGGCVRAGAVGGRVSLEVSPSTLALCIERPKSAGIIRRGVVILLGILCSLHWCDSGGLGATSKADTSLVNTTDTDINPYGLRNIQFRKNRT